MVLLQDKGFFVGICNGMFYQFMNSFLYQRRREFILRDIGSVYKGRNENEVFTLVVGVFQLYCLSSSDMWCLDKKYILKEGIKVGQDLGGNFIIKEKRV